MTEFVGAPVNFASQAKTSLASHTSLELKTNLALELIHTSHKEEIDRYIHIYKLCYSVVLDLGYRQTGLATNLLLYPRQVAFLELSSMSHLEKY